MHLLEHLEHTHVRCTARTATGQDQPDTQALAGGGGAGGRRSNGRLGYGLRADGR